MSLNMNHIVHPLTRPQGEINCKIASLKRPRMKFLLSLWALILSNAVLQTLPWEGGGWTGVLPEKLGRSRRPASQNPYPIYDQNLRFSLPYLWPGQKFSTLFMTFAAGTVTLNISYGGLLLTVLLIMMKK